MKIPSPKRLPSRADHLRPEHIPFSISIVLPAITRSPRKSQLTRSRSLYLESENLPGTKRRPSRRNPLISRFPPQSSLRAFPRCTASPTNNSGPVSAPPTCESFCYLRGRGGLRVSKHSCLRLSLVCFPIHGVRGFRGFISAVHSLPLIYPALRRFHLGCHQAWSPYGSSESSPGDGLRFTGLDLFGETSQ